MGLGKALQDGVGAQPADVGDVLVLAVSRKRGSGKPASARSQTEGMKERSQRRIGSTKSSPPSAV
jgi:hypothetical protein